MMPERISINPLTRISGFMEIEADVHGGVVTDARTEGLLFRGFELMLKDRSPFDAVYFTERICGICSTAHAVASSLALEDALGIEVSEQGRYLRDVIHGCEFLQNHIRHFYQLTVPGYVRLPEKLALFRTDNTDFRLPYGAYFVFHAQCGCFPAYFARQQSIMHPSPPPRSH
jgi:hydrogenase large subunit